MTVQKIGKIIAVVGAILIYGAIGAIDCETITFTQFSIALVHRILLTLLGLYLAYGYEPVEQDEYIEVD
jgi:hypothetical protein